MSTVKTVNLQNPASGIINGTLNADGTTTFGGPVTFNAAQTFPNAISSLTAGTGLTGGTITTTGTIALNTAYTDARYLPLAGGTMTGDITFSGTQTFPNAVSSITAGAGLTGGTITATGTFALDTTYTDGLYLSLAGGTMTGDITFSGTQTFPAQDLQTVTGAGATTTDTVDVGGLIASGLTYPSADGVSGDYLTTDGAGNLGWTTPPTTPDLDTVTSAGNTTANAIDIGGLTASGLAYPTSDGTANQVISTDGAGTLGWLSTVTVVTPPASSTVTGNPGEVAYDASWFYWYDGAHWQRVAADPAVW